MEGVQVVGNDVTLCTCMPKLTHRGSIIAPRAKSDVYDRVVYGPTHYWCLFRASFLGDGIGYHDKVP